MRDRWSGGVADDSARDGPDRSKHHRTRQGPEGRIAAAVLICERLR
jgi:hypothetical protein